MKLGPEPSKKYTSEWYKCDRKLVWNTHGYCVQQTLKHDFAQCKSTEIITLFHPIEVLIHKTLFGQKKWRQGCDLTKNKILKNG